MNEELGVDLGKINDSGIFDSISVIGFAQVSIFVPDLLIPTGLSY